MKYGIVGELSSMNTCIRSSKMFDLSYSFLSYFSNGVWGSNGKGVPFFPFFFFLSFFLSFFCLPTGGDDEGGGQGETGHGRHAQRYTGMPTPAAAAGAQDPSAATADARRRPEEASDPVLHPAPIPHRVARRPDPFPTITSDRLRRP